jgi:hypothetical protein
VRVSTPCQSLPLVLYWSMPMALALALALVLVLCLLLGLFGSSSLSSAAGLEGKGHCNPNDLIHDNRRQSLVTRYDVPSYQVEALQDLYVSTNGWQWYWKEPELTFGAIWDFNQSNPNPCSERWQGITCSSDCSSSPCVITELILDEYGLHGTLPMSLGNITSLTSLEIYSNPFLSG